MNAATMRRLLAAVAAEQKATQALVASRARLAAAMETAADQGASVRELAEITGQSKSVVHRAVAR